MYLPHWPTDRLRRRNDLDRPLVLTLPGSGGLRIAAVDARAAAEGLRPGQRLADARALVPVFCALEADLAADTEALGHLADWCSRYTPWTAIDGDDGIILDITGCAHLFDGETGLIADLSRRFKSFGLTASIAIADTPAAAWAWSRFGRDLGGPILTTSEARRCLPPLPVEALRLSADIVDGLHRLGIRKIAELMNLPRGPLAARFGKTPLSRLDRAFGIESEPISPRRLPAQWQSRLSFPDGISRRDDLDLATRKLLDALCRALEKDGRGARLLELALYRLDGSTQFLDIGTSKPARDPVHLARLFVEKLGTVDPGFGVETMILSAVATDSLSPQQAGFSPGTARGAEDLATVIDRLQNRMGASAVVRFVPIDSHTPERAMTIVPALTPPGYGEWPSDYPRPIRLLAAPELIDVIGFRDRLPQSFRWRRIDHHVVHADGPERIAPEWWRGNAAQAARDYFWFQDTEGRRYWVYCVHSPQPSPKPAWYLHGLFA